MSKLTLLVAALVVLGFSSKSQAQSNITNYGGIILPQSMDRGASPTVSPYLNLLNNTGLAGNSYQQLVRPLVDGREAAQANASSIRRLQQRVGGGGGGGRGGNPTLSKRFLNLGHYYGR